MKLFKEQSLKWIEENKNKLFEISDKLWENPELAMQEYFASGLITKYLEEQGYTVKRDVAGMPTAFIAEYGTEGPRIGFNCEYDALASLSQDKDKTDKCAVISGGPGHGCGHNLLAVGGIMAATSVKSLIDSGDLKARIVIFGTPAEEVCIGKPFMAREGCFKDVDCVLDWHALPYSKAGYNETIAFFNCKYHFKGRTAHGNSPWFGKSALDATILMSNALEFMREHLPPGKPEQETTFNYIFENAGQAPNVIPDSTTIWCVGRMGTSEEIMELKRRVDNCADAAALATDTVVERELITMTHEKIPNKILSEVMERNLEMVGLPVFSAETIKEYAEIQEKAGLPVRNVCEEVRPFECTGMGLTDSSEYSWFAPTDILLLQLIPEGLGWHNWIVTKFAGGDAGKAVVTTAAKVLAMSCIELIETPRLIEEAKKELAERLNGRVYQALFDDNIKPNLSLNKEEMQKYR